MFRIKKKTIFKRKFLQNFDTFDIRNANNKDLSIIQKIMVNCDYLSILPKIINFECMHNFTSFMKLGKFDCFRKIKTKFVKHFDQSLSLDSYMIKSDNFIDYQPILNV